MALVGTTSAVRRRGLRRLSCGALLAALLWTTGSLPERAHGADSYSEDAVKAAFLYRFAGYVQWPQGAPAGEFFTIAVLQADAVAEELQRFLPGHLVAGRPVRTRVLKTIRDLGDAQILYVGAVSQVSLRQLLAPLAGRPVLVVTNDERGLEDGGMINFLSVDRHVRFEVSLVASDRADLKISAELLSVAARVEGGRLRSEASCIPSWAMDEEGAFRCPLRIAAR